MAGELLAFRRASMGAPIADYAKLVDRARVNLGGKGSGFYQQATTASSVFGTTLTADATPHTEAAAWLEIAAVSTFDAETIIVYISAGTTVSNTNTSMLLDIGIGPDSGNVTAIVSRLNVGYGITGQTFVLPYALPSGSQLWGRVRGAVTVDELGVSIQLRQAGAHSAAPTVITTYGANDTTSNGVTLTAPSGTNAKPASFDTITAATTADARFLLVAASLPAATTNATASTGLCDIAIGGSGSETVIMENLPFSVSGNEFVTAPIGLWAIPLSRSIPTGTRLSARYQSTSTAAGARIALIAYGFGP